MEPVRELLSDIYKNIKIKFKKATNKTIYLMILVNLLFVLFVAIFLFYYPVRIHILAD